MNNPTVVLTKMNDGLFNVSNGEKLKTNQTESLALGTCVWEFGIRRSTIEMALNTMKQYGNDMIVFFNDTEYTTKKIDYSNMLK